MDGSILFLEPCKMQAIEFGGPSERPGLDVLARTGGCGYRILRFSGVNKRWEVLGSDGKTTEDRLAIHNWCYLS